MLALSSQQAEATELQLDFIASYDRLQEAVTQISLVAYSWYRHHRLYFTATPECLERRLHDLFAPISIGLAFDPLDLDRPVVAVECGDPAHVIPVRNGMGIVMFRRPTRLCRFLADGGNGV